MQRPRMPLKNILQTQMSKNTVKLEKAPNFLLSNLDVMSIIEVWQLQNQS